MAQLISLSGDGRILRLGDRVAIGRDPSNELCIPDASVSRKHAEITRLGNGKFRVVDLGSRHGTLVQQRRLAEATLADGDELKIGCARFRFLEREPEEAGLDKTLLRLSVAEDPDFRPAGAIRSEAELRLDYEKLRAAFELSRAIGVEHHLPTLLSRILDTAIPLLSAERGAIALLDPDTLSPTLQIGRLRGGVDDEVLLSASLLREVALAKAGIISADAASDGRFAGAQSICEQGIRSLMCVPMFYGGALIGAMQLDSNGAGLFREKDLQLFSVVTSQAAVAIQNALLVQRAGTLHAEHRARLERIVRGLPDGVVLLDEESRIVMANRRAGEILPSLTRIGAGEVLDQLGGQPLERILAQGTLELKEAAARRTFAVSELSLGDVDDAQTLLVIREVTEEREQQARASQQERLALIGQFAAGIAHDFNNLLAVISTQAEFLEDDAPDEQFRADARTIRDATARAAELTRRVLTFGRREMVNPRVVDVHRVVADTAAIVSRTLGEHVTLTSELCAERALVRADPTQLEQVLLNLALNARDAMPSGGVVRISSANVEQGGSHFLELLISDNGSGMSPEVLARVFEPFFTTKPRGQGTGLGLATVYGIVTQAGGSISIDSELGRGTTFRLRFPCATGEPARAEVPLLKSEGGRATILLVEDERAVRQSTRRSLERAGYQVLEASCRREALEVAAKEHVDLLLTDVVMPGGSGTELCDELQRSHAGLPVLFTSGYFDDKLASEQLRPNVGFLAKPFTRDELLRQTGRALGRGASPRPV